MKFKSILFLFVSLFYVEASFSSGLDVIKDLRNEGQLIRLDDPSLSIFKTEADDCSDCVETRMGANSNNPLKGICEVITSSDTCKDIPQEDLMNCNKWKTSQAPGAMDMLKKCGIGFAGAVKDILDFMWKAMKWSFDKAIRPMSSYHEASDYMDSTKLYLVNEYQKSYEKTSSGPGKKLRAAYKMIAQMSNKIRDTIMTYLRTGVKEFGCLNNAARSEKICEIATLIFFPPTGAILVVKNGPKAIRALLSPANFKNQVKLNVQLVEGVTLGRKLTKVQKEALRQAMKVGDPTNYKKRHITKKFDILQRAGFTNKELYSLLKEGNLNYYRGIDAALKGKSLPKTVRKGKKAFERKFNHDLHFVLSEKPLSMSDKKATAFREAWQVGLGEAGKGSSLFGKSKRAGNGNWTKAQRDQKTKILKEAGFDSQEINRLFEFKLLGSSDKQIANYQAYLKRKNIKDVPTGDYALSIQAAKFDKNYPDLLVSLGLAKSSPKAVAPKKSIDLKGNVQKGLGWLKNKTTKNKTSTPEKSNLQNLKTLQPSAGPKAPTPTTLAPKSSIESVTIKLPTSASSPAAFKSLSEKILKKPLTSEQTRALIKWKEMDLAYYKNGQKINRSAARQLIKETGLTAREIKLIRKNKFINRLFIERNTKTIKIQPPTSPAKSSVTIKLPTSASSPTAFKSLSENILKKSLTNEQTRALIKWKQMDLAYKGGQKINRVQARQLIKETGLTAREIRLIRKNNRINKLFIERNIKTIKIQPPTGFPKTSTPITPAPKTSTPITPAPKASTSTTPSAKTSFFDSIKNKTNSLKDNVKKVSIPTESVSNAVKKGADAAKSSANSLKDNVKKVSIPTESVSNAVKKGANSLKDNVKKVSIPTASFSKTLESGKNSLQKGGESFKRGKDSFTNNANSLKEGIKKVSIPKVSVPNSFRNKIKNPFAPKASAPTTPAPKATPKKSTSKKTTSKKSTSKKTTSKKSTSKKKASKKKASKKKASKKKLQH